MLSLNDIINVSFRKVGALSGKGYNADDVDNFIERVRESYEELSKKTIDQGEKIEKLETEKRKSDEKIKILAEKAEEYRAQEDEIKDALISAQKLGDASVREARHKAEIILNDANLKAERIIAGSDKKAYEQRKELERLQNEASDFRAKLLNMYKEHLTLINAMPVQRAEPEQEEIKQETKHEPQQEAAAQPQQTVEPVPEPEAKNTPEPLQAEISYFEEDDSENKPLPRRN